MLRNRMTTRGLRTKRSSLLALLFVLSSPVVIAPGLGPHKPQSRFVEKPPAAIATPVAAYPLEATIARVRHNLRNAQIEPTNLGKNDYLETIAGIVDYFQHFQAGDGRIIDPYVHREVQYSTPCYAWAAAALVASGKQPALLQSASRGLDVSLQELDEGKPADGHGDFFTFPVMLAYEALRDRVSPQDRKRWEDKLRAIDPLRAYRDVITEKHPAVHNWNVVALSGEFLRHQDGFTDDAFVEKYLKTQLTNFTPEGLYRDPNTPMAYDLFPRHFLAVMLARGYRGLSYAELSELIERSAWTSLLLQSPTGEWPTGGRSAQHQWNEAMECVLFEVWAARKERQGDHLAAQAFKRAAHLALASVRRWVRPSGELWIVKNRFDPAVRHGFEGYSFHSQYNLLAASMMATAWQFADDAIPEGPSPADVGGFVVPLQDFHKVIANAGGLYLELDSAADPKYNSTGLIRVQKAGVDPFVGPTDVSAIDDAPLAVGIAWPEGDGYVPLAAMGQGKITGSQVRIERASPEEVRFSVLYDVNQPLVQAVLENYELTPSRVRVTAQLKGKAPRLQIRFPVLLFDGEHSLRVAVAGDSASVELGKSSETFRVESPPGVKLRLSKDVVKSRNGFLGLLKGEANGNTIVYTLTPQQESKIH
ncbi:MAG: hypothetical protein ACYDA9_08015 [Terriglobia bacterium]